MSEGSFIKADLQPKGRGVEYVDRPTAEGTRRDHASPGDYRLFKVISETCLVRFERRAAIRVSMQFDDDAESLFGEAAGALSADPPQTLI